MHLGSCTYSYLSHIYIFSFKEPVNSCQSIYAPLLLLLLLFHFHSDVETQTQAMGIREAITLGQTAVQSPLAPAEICSAPHPTVSPNISSRHRPAAPCPHHQSVPAPGSLINDDPCRRERGLGDGGGGIRGQQKGTGAAVLTTRVVPQCHTTVGRGCSQREREEGEEEVGRWWGGVRWGWVGGGGQ